MLFQTLELIFFDACKSSPITRWKPYCKKHEHKVSLIASVDSSLVDSSLFAARGMKKGFQLSCVFSGVLGQPRTCLHALLNILQQGVDSGSGPQCLHNTPRLAELAYQLVYKLCALRDTSPPTLRYLRTTYDFLFQQLRHLPFDQMDYSEFNLWQCLTLSCSRTKTCFHVIFEKKHSCGHWIRRLTLAVSIQFCILCFIGLDSKCSRCDVPLVSFKKVCVCVCACVCVCDLPDYVFIILYKVRRTSNA